MIVPAIIDIEASGFGKGSYPIEIGYALSDQKAISHLVHPQDDWTHWSDEAQSIHGISREQLMSQGQSVRAVALALNQNLTGEVLYSDAWSFDSSWLARLFDAAKIVQRFRLETLNYLLTPEQIERWHMVKKGLWKELNITRHRAANDVKVLQETYIRVMSEK